MSTADPIVVQAIKALGGHQQAADKLKVSKSLIYKILAGKRTPTDEMLRELGLQRVELITRAQ